MATQATPPTEEKMAPPAPPAAPEAKGKAKRSLALSPNLMTFIVVVAVFGYLIYGSWQAFEAAPVTAAPKVAATPAIPELKLNQENKRQAPPITVDQNGIGKSDPFSP